MGYRKITNLSETHPVLLFKEIYCLEKIHGTSAHISFKKAEGKWSIEVMPGGIKITSFMHMLNKRYSLDTDVLQAVIKHYENTGVDELIVYGEGYGGSCQKMSSTYGDLNFIAFEVCKIVDGREFWYGVEDAARLLEIIKLPFVYFDKGPSTIEWITSQRDRPSEQAKRNGQGENKESEGVVIRGPVELFDNYGGRMMAKFRKLKFGETNETEEKAALSTEAVNDANSVADKFVVENRLDHVLSKLAVAIPEITIKHTGTVIKAMVADIFTEEGKTLEWSDAVERAITKKTSEMFRARCIKGVITNPVTGFGPSVT